MLRPHNQRGNKDELHPSNLNRGWPVSEWLVEAAHRHPQRTEMAHLRVSLSLFKRVTYTQRMLFLVAEMADSSEIVPVYDPVWQSSQVTDLYTQHGSAPQIWVPETAIKHNRLYYHYFMTPTHAIYNTLVMIMTAVKCIMRSYEWVLNSCDRHHENVKSYLTFVIW